MIYHEGLPVYEILVDDEGEFEVDKVSIVQNPAIESNFLSFGKNTKAINFNTNEDKHELLGAALIPDVPIYRKLEGKEFYVVFGKDTIKKIATNLFKKGYNTSMNVEHSNISAESYIYSSYIVDPDLGLYPPKGLEELPEGSWIIGVKVESPSLWADIKSGKKNGFSVEGFFTLEEIDEDTFVDLSREYFKELTKLENLLSKLK